MNRRQFLRRSCWTVAAASPYVLAPAARAEDRTAVKDLAEVLEPVRKEHNLPGLAGAAVQGGRIVAAGVTGVRQVGKDDKIGLDDRFLLGSCTKAMTVLVVCRLVDAGKLDFSTTLGESLPDVKMRDEYRKVTLAQLLTFKGGIQPYTRIGPAQTPILFGTGPVADRRRRFIEHVLQEEPITKPGGEMKYSNASYAVAAFVATQQTKAEYEALVKEHVFTPLHMDTAGFGSPRTKDRPNEPASHVKQGGVYVAVPDRERPAEQLLAPAGGGCYCSIRDFARFATRQLATAQGKDTLLKSETARRAREALPREFPAGGTNFGGTPWLHAGLQVVPKKDIAVVVATNCGSGDEVCIAALKAVRESLGVG
jgi:CubicO group peptidase (beta-lactamase class C family)